MDEQQISQIVQRVLERLRSTEGPSATAPIPAEGDIADLSRVDLKAQYLVDRPHDREAFLSLKERTPARVGAGRAGARYRTATMLRFMADHAAAQAAVFSDVDDAFLSGLGLLKYRTACASRDEFLTRPDLGRTFAPETLDEIRAKAGTGNQVLLYLADGLSSSAVRANAADVLPVIQKGLEGYGIRVNAPFFVQYGRVGAMDALAEALGAEVACVLLGERPGLVTAKSMSAYLAYRPTVGMPESRRTVVANIHPGGTPAVEAGAHIVDLIRLMLKEQKSGVDLPI